MAGTSSPAGGGNGGTVTLRGAASATATANGSGAFAFSGLPNGTCTLTPSHTGYTFNPTSQNVTVSGANVMGVNITATVQVGQTFTISGTISPTAGGSGVAVALSGAASATTTSNSSGAYTFTGLANGAYIVTTSNARFTFTPSNQSVSVNVANVSGLNFTATTQASSGGGGSGGSWIPGYRQQSSFHYNWNTNLTGVCPPNNFNGTNYAWATNCVNIYDAWGGAAYDQAGHRMVIWGGG